MIKIKLKSPSLQIENDIKLDPLIGSQKYYCRYCERQFNNRQNESKHRLKHCKLNPTHSQYKATDTLIDEVDEICETTIISTQIVNSNENNLVIELVKNQQIYKEQIEQLQKELEKIKNISITPKTTFKCYFHSKLDLYDQVVSVKGEDWARNYFLCTLFSTGRYLDAIIEFVVFPNIENSPIRLNDDNHIVFYRNQTQFDVDITGNLLEQELKHIMQRCVLRAFNRPTHNQRNENHADYIKEIVVLEEAIKYFKITESNEMELNYKYERLAKFKSLFDQIETEIFVGNNDIKSINEFHKILEKINNYKILAKTKKDFMKHLPKSIDAKNT